MKTHLIKQNKRKEKSKERMQISCRKHTRKPNREMKWNRPRNPVEGSSSCYSKSIKKPPIIIYHRLENGENCAKKGLQLANTQLPRSQPVHSSNGLRRQRGLQNNALHPMQCEAPVSKIYKQSNEYILEHHRDTNECQPAMSIVPNQIAMCKFGAEPWLGRQTCANCFHTTSVHASPCQIAKTVHLLTQDQGNGVLYRFNKENSKRKRNKTPRTKSHNQFRGKVWQLWFFYAVQHFGGVCSEYNSLNIIVILRQR
jgi:hypothetical protein